MKINEFIETKTPVQQAIEEHVARGVPFRECIFRPGSIAFREFYRTVRDLHSQGLVECDWEDEELLETEIGELVRLNDEVVPLDVPFMEDMSDEEVDEFHRELDKLVHKYLGHSSDEKEHMEGHSPHPKGSAKYKKHMAAMHAGMNENVMGGTIEFLAKTYDEMLSDGEDQIRARYNMHDQLASELEDINASKQDSVQAHRALEELLIKIMNKHDRGMKEAEYQGRKVELNKPKRGGSKKFYVYVKNPKTGKVKKVSWGDTSGLSVKAKDRGAVKSFVARHKCKQKNDKTKAGYWACRTPRYKSLGVKGGQWW